MEEKETILHIYQVKLGISVAVFPKEDVKFFQYRGRKIFYITFIVGRMKNLLKA
jgi:hypothetical protein